MLCYTSFHKKRTNVRKQTATGGNGIYSNRHREIPEHPVIADMERFGAYGYGRAVSDRSYKEVRRRGGRGELWREENNLRFTGAIMRR